MEEFAIPSNTNVGKYYIVYNSKHKGWMCECKWFVMTHTECSHIRKAQAKVKQRAKS